MIWKLLKNQENYKALKWKFSIVNRVLLGFSILILLILGMALASFLSNKRYEDIVLRKTLVDQAMESLFKIRLDEKDYINTGEPASSAAVDVMLNELIEFMQRDDVLNQDSTSRARKTEISNELYAYQRAFQHYEDLSGLKRKMQDSMAVNAEDASRYISNFKSDLRQQLSLALDSSKYKEDDKLEKADGANRIIKLTLDARRFEKNYEIYGQSHFRDSVLNTIQEIENLTKSLNAAFTDQSNKAMAQGIINSLNSYKAGMEDLSGLDDEQSRTAIRMEQNARSLELYAQEIRKNLREQYQALEKENASRLVLQDKLQKSDEANRIIKWVLDARREEKNYQLRNDPVHYYRADSLINNVIVLAKDLSQRFQSEDNKQLSDRILNSSGLYLSALESYKELFLFRTLAQDGLVNSARKVENLAREIRTDQKEELSYIRESRDIYIRDRIAKADEASELLNLEQEVRVSINSYIIGNGDPVIKRQVDSLFQEILEHTGSLESRFNNPGNVIQISRFKDEVLNSASIFIRFVRATGEQDLAMLQLIENGTDILEINSVYQVNMGLKLDQTRKWANLLNIFASIFALILGLLFAFIIIRQVRRDLDRLAVTEAELRNNEQHLKTILDTAYEGFIFIGKDLAIVDVNPVMCEILQREREEVIGKTFSGFIDPGSQDTFQKQIERRREGLRSAYEMSFLKKDGSSVPCLLNASPYMDKGGKITGSFAMVKDISDFKALEMELKEARDTAESATRAKSDFLARMSHEIRTPLNAILGLTYITLNDQFGTKTRENLRKIHRSGQSLLVIINDILDFSKIESGKIELEELEFDLERNFMEFSEILAVRAQEKNLELIPDIPLDVPKMLIGDPYHLKQVFMNLVGNAIKFTDKGEVIVKAEVLERKETRILLKFSVKDSGIGIRKEELGKLFQSFSQADISTTRNYGGTGLGLAICKNLIEQMGGEIRVESEYGAGSTFFFTAWFSVSANQVHSHLSENEKLKEKTVLVCSSISSSREFLIQALTAFRMQALSSVSLKDALSILSKQDGGRVDLLIIDWNTLNQSDLQRYETLENLADNLDVQIITVLPASRQEEYQRSGAQAESQLILLKPYTYSALFNVIMNAFGGEILPEEDKELHSQALDELRKQVAGAFILVVDDHPLNHDVVIGLLEPAGISFDVVSNGEMALDRARRSGDKKEYDLILMDLQMPVMDGYTATRKIRELEGFSELPIIAMTADAIAGVKERCVEAGMSDFISKPIVPGELYRMIAHWIPAARRQNVESLPREDRLGSDLSLPQFDHINTDKGLSQLDGNRALYVKLLNKFYNSYLNFRTEIEDALRKEDFAEAERLIHTLKGSAGTIGAMDLFNMATVINEKQKEQKSPEGGSELEELIAELKAVCGEIQMHLPGPEDSVRPTSGERFDLSEFIADLEQLLELLKSGSFESLELVKKMASEAGNELTSGTMQKISDFATAYNFDEAYGLAVKLKNGLHKNG